MRRAARAAPAGFTLIELMAVIVLLGLAAALVVPNLGVTRNAALRREARGLAAYLELARQHAVMTGRPHRVLIGVDEGWYVVEWFVTDAQEARALSLDTNLPPDDPDLLDLRLPIPLAPPRSRVPSYRPVPGDAGRVHWLDEDLRFEGIELAEGWLDRGEVQIVFDGDGSTDAARIVVHDAAGDAGGLVLEVAPLIDHVRVRDDADA